MTTFLALTRLTVGADPRQHRRELQEGLERTVEEMVAQEWTPADIEGPLRTPARPMRWTFEARNEDRTRFCRRSQPIPRHYHCLPVLLGGERAERGGIFMGFCRFRKGRDFRSVRVPASLRDRRYKVLPPLVLQRKY